MYNVHMHAGSGATAVVQVARCLKNDKKVAIKRIDLERCGSTIEELQVCKELVRCRYPRMQSIMWSA